MFSKKFNNYTLIAKYFSLVSILAFWLYCCFLWVGADAALIVVIIYALFFFKYRINNPPSEKISEYLTQNSKIFFYIGLSNLLFLNINIAILNIFISLITFYIINGINLDKLKKFYFEYSIVLISLHLIGIIYRQIIPDFDYGPDSINYIKWAIAFRNHLSGMNINADQFGLGGINNAGIDFWVSGSPLTFSEVLGTKNSLYPMLLGWLLSIGFSISEFQYIHMIIVACGLCAWAKLFSFFIEDKKLIIVFYLFTILDSHIIASIITIWREFLLIYVIPIIIISFLNLNKINSKYYMKYSVTLFIFLFFLSGFRYHLFILLIIICVIFSLISSIKFKSFHISARIVCISGASLMTSVLFTSSHHIPLMNNLVGPLQFSISQIWMVNSGEKVDKAQISSAENATNKANFDTANNKASTDTALISWDSKIQSSGYKPVLLDSISATLFAPNPNWLRDSPHWKAASFISMPEQTLLYPGMFLIILFTPLFIYGVFHAVFLVTNIRFDILLILITSILIIVFYTAFYGSFSGRYRIQLVPVFYLLSFYGFSKIRYFKIK